MTGLIIVEENLESTPYTTQTSSYTGKTTVTGTNTVVSYTITGGKLYSINLDQEAHSLHIQMDATTDGSLTLTLPRTLIDAKMGNNDDTFFVLVNGDEVDFEESTTSSQRTLTIQFPSGTNQIDVIGTTVNSDSNYSPTPYNPQPTPYTTQTSSYTGKTTVTGTNTVVSYTITGGKLYSITPSADTFSLITTMTASQDGSLVITLPRSLIDAKKSNGNDDIFIVIMDGEEASYNEKPTSSSSRIITIEFPAGTNQIDVLGTTVNFPSNYSPKQTPYTPTPYVPTPVIPSDVNIVIPSGTGTPGCENTNSCYEPNKFAVGKGSTVTWFNSDSVAHTVTSGIPSNGPTGEFDSSLLSSRNSFSHKFNDDGTYPYYCMVHPWMTGYVIVQRGGTMISPSISSPIPSPTPTTSGAISISTDNFQYSPGDLVTVKVSTSKSANVAVSVISPSGDNIISRTVSTDSGGSGSLQFKLPESSQNGSYRVDSTATISGSTVSDSTTFTVKSTLSRVNIVSLQPTDQQGNAVSSFTKGKLGFVKVVLSSDSNANSLVTINLFDSELTSLGIGSFKTTLGSGQSEMTLSFFIPNDAKTGNGDIYANVFSDWPSQGGVPLTGESSTQVRIQ